MEAKELRIGNYVNYNGYVAEIVEIKRTVCMIRFKENDLDCCPKVEYDDLKPIELTEEWLLKIEFKKLLPNLGELTQQEIYLGNLRTVLTFYKKPFTFNVSNGWWMYERKMDNPPKYVHKLQNIYFALTGEELTIKQ